MSMCHLIMYIYNSQPAIEGYLVSIVQTFVTNDISIQMSARADNNFFIVPENV